MGTGGWAYLPVKAVDKLRAYSRLFNFVEVNSTFYFYPKLSTVRSWRRRVPRDFIFSVKCHRDVTHKYRLRPVEGTFKALDYMFQVCRLLRSDMLVLQTPPSLSLTDDFIRDLGSLLNNLSPPKIHFIWEVRRPRGKPLPERLLRLMEDLNIVQAVDLTREDPPRGQRIVYSRLFGRGGGSIEPFSDEELEEIFYRISRSRALKAVLTFHGARMYQDALKFKRKFTASRGNITRLI